MSKLETNTIDTVSGTSTLQVGSTNTSTITLGVSGDTINVPSGVTIANSGTATGFGGTNTPAFLAKMGSTQTISTSSTTKLQYDTEVFDTDGKYDNSSNYRFTPTVAGKYQVGMQVRFVGAGLQNVKLFFYKNGSQHKRTEFSQANTSQNQSFAVFTTIIELDADDYIEAYINASGSTSVYGNNDDNYFLAYKLIE